MRLYNIKKSLNKPLLSKNFITLNISDSIQRKKEFFRPFANTCQLKTYKEKNRNTFNLLNEFENAINTNEINIRRKNEKHSVYIEKNNDKFIKFKGKTQNEHILNKNNSANKLNIIEFLPFTQIKLHDFDEINNDFLISNKENNMIDLKFIEILNRNGKNFSFLQVYYYFLAKKCASKKCPCAKGRLKTNYSNKNNRNPFIPTNLTPVIENLEYN